MSLTIKQHISTDSGQKYSDTSNIPCIVYIKQHISTDSGQKYSDTSNIPYIVYI